MRKCIYIATVVLFSLGGCQQVTQSFKDTFKNTEGSTGRDTISNTAQGMVHLQLNPGTGQRTDYVQDTDYLQTAENQLQALPEFKGKTVMLYELVYFYGTGQIDVYVQNPDEPKYIDAYHYEGGSWGAPQPKQLSKREEEGIPAKIFPLQDFSFSTAAKVLHAYNEKAQSITGAKREQTVYYIHSSTYTSWYPIGINGTREKWTILFNEDGSMKSFERD